MQRILSTDLPRHLGQRVRIAGWVHRRRQLARVAFLVVRDRAGPAQVVVRDEGGRERLGTLAEQTAVEVHGTAVGNPAAPAGVELVDATVHVLPPDPLRGAGVRLTG
jgi:nondiscriminating aspartyl-tRNA synthetase